MEMPINALNRIINLTAIFWDAGSDDDAHFLHWLREGDQDPSRLLNAIGDRLVLQSHLLSSGLKASPVMTVHGPSLMPPSPP